MVNSQISVVHHLHLFSQDGDNYLSSLLSSLHLRWGDCSHIMSQSDRPVPWTQPLVHHWYTLIGFLLYSYLKLKRKKHPRDHYTVQLLQKGRAVTVVKHRCESKANSSRTPALPLSAACFYCAGGRGYKIGLSCAQRVSLHIRLGCAKVSCEVKCQYKR